MKKIFLLFLLIASTLITNAQNFSIGPTIGFGHSWIDHLNRYAYGKYKGKFTPALNAGISLVYNPEKHFAFGTDIIYSAEGDKAHTSGFFGGDVISPAGISTYHVNYIRIPVKFIYLFGKVNNILRPKIYIGPDFGFRCGLKTVFKDEQGNTFKSGDNNQFKKFDFGGIAAVGMNVRLHKNLSLNTDVQYYQGLIDILRDYSPAYHISGYNGNIEFNAGLMFSFK